MRPSICRMCISSIRQSLIELVSAAGRKVKEKINRSLASFLSRVGLVFYGVD